jgi:hypothetical protein
MRLSCHTEFLEHSNRTSVRRVAAGPDPVKVQLLEAEAKYLPG